MARHYESSISNRPFALQNRHIRSSVATENMENHVQAMYEGLSKRNMCDQVYPRRKLGYIFSSLRFALRTSYFWFLIFRANTVFKFLRFWSLTTRALYLIQFGQWKYVKLSVRHSTINLKTSSFLQWPLRLVWSAECITFTFAVQCSRNVYKVMWLNHVVVSEPLNFFETLFIWKVTKFRNFIPLFYD